METPRQSDLKSSFRGVNHLKLPCFSIQDTMDFYTEILTFDYIPEYDHFTPTHEVFAKMCRHPQTNLLLECRYAPAQANAQKGWDPITWSIATRQDLESWAQWLGQKGVKRSPIFTGIKSWVMGCEDPDGRIVRLYVSEEEHEWTDYPDRDEYWLGSVEADPRLIER